jgi:hypothetical protein
LPARKAEDDAERLVAKAERCIDGHAPYTLSVECQEIVDTLSATTSLTASDCDQPYTEIE